MMNVPEIILQKSHWHELPDKHFKNATDGKPASQETNIKLKYDDDYLYIDFECRQNPFSKENTYTEHNSDMWNQEVLELFISDEVEKPIHYLEFEINPNNVIWVGRINNPSGVGHIYADTRMVAYEKAGIKHHVKVQDDVWMGNFQIPFNLIGKKQSVYRLNFYRIISTKSHKSKNWVGSPKDCLYLCWNPTMSGKSPAFHRTAAFGRLVLK